MYFSRTFLWPFLQFKGHKRSLITVDKMKIMVIDVFTGGSVANMSEEISGWNFIFSSIFESVTYCMS